MIPLPDLNEVPRQSIVPGSRKKFTWWNEADIITARKESSLYARGIGWHAERRGSRRVNPVRNDAPLGFESKPLEFLTGFTLVQRWKEGGMNILWVVNTNTFLLVLLVIMVSYLTIQLNAVIRWLKRE